MKLMTKEIEKKLIKQGNETLNAPEKDWGKKHKPYLKLFGGGSCTWLISEYDAESNMFFGLCDLGLGTPEFGYVSKSELESIKFPPFNLPVERDLLWKPTKNMWDYWEEAQKQGSIINI